MRCRREAPAHNNPVTMRLMTFSFTQNEKKSGSLCVRLMTFDASPPPDEDSTRFASARKRKLPDPLFVRPDNYSTSMWISRIVSSRSLFAPSYSNAVSPVFRVVALAGSARFLFLPADNADRRVGRRLQSRNRESVPQISHEPYRPLRISLMARSICCSSRLSNAASWLCISFCVPSIAASNKSPVPASAVRQIELVGKLLA